MRLDKALFTILDEPFTWKDIILIVGGLFLLAKATMEIHAQLEGPEVEEGTKVVTTFAGVLGQIIAIEEIAEIRTRTAPRIALLAPSVLFDDNTYVEPHQRTNIGCQRAIGCCDQHEVLVAG